MILEKIKGRSGRGYFAICKCDKCGKIFERPFTLVENRGNNFCSRGCMGVWNSLNRTEENSPMYGKTVTEETKQKLRENHRDISGKNNPMYGKRRIGEDNPMWKGGIRKSGNYVLIKSYDHPNCTKDGYIFKHRLIMEKHLGRYLTKKEIVHHKDGNGTNNHIDNLELMTGQSEHVTYHNRNRGEYYGYIS